MFTQAANDFPTEPSSGDTLRHRSGLGRLRRTSRCCADRLQLPPLLHCLISPEADIGISDLESTLGSSQRWGMSLQCYTDGCSCCYSDAQALAPKSDSGYAASSAARSTISALATILTLIAHDSQKMGFGRCSVSCNGMSCSQQWTRTAQRDLQHSIRSVAFGSSNRTTRAEQHTRTMKTDPIHPPSAASPHVRMTNSRS